MQDPSDEGLAVKPAAPPSRALGARLQDHIVLREIIMAQTQHVCLLQRVQQL